MRALFLICAVVVVSALASVEAEARLFQRLRNRGGCGASNGTQPIRNVIHRAAGVFSGGGCNGGSCSVR